MHKTTYSSLEEYCYELLNDSINYKYKGFIFGNNRSKNNYILMYPDSTHVFYKLSTNGKIKIISIDSKIDDFDSIGIVKRLQEIANFTKKHNIYIIDSKKDYMEVVFDLKVINIDFKENQKKGVFVFCNINTDSVLKIPQIDYYKPKIILPRVLYYEEK